MQSSARLWNTDLSGSYLAAVETFSIKNKEKLKIKPESVFFNDGVTLMNVSYCRENKLIEKSLKLINKFNGAPPVLSEGVLNFVCQGQVKIISMKNNLMSGMYQLGIENPKYLSSITSYSEDDITDSCQFPIIIHYLSAFYNRPWTKDCTHPLKDYYLKYKQISPWKEQCLENGSLSLKLNCINQLGKLIGFSKVMRISHIKNFFFNNLS